MHWFDADSAALLHHLVVSHGATVVATSRSDVPAGPSITALWKDWHLTRLDLGPLVPTQLDAVLEAALGAPVEPRTVRRLHDRTGGNVLLTRQLIEDARADGSLELAHGAWVERSSNEPSGRLVDLLAGRIDALDPDERPAPRSSPSSAPSRPSCWTGPYRRRSSSGCGPEGGCPMRRSGGTGWCGWPTR